MLVKPFLRYYFSGDKKENRMGGFIRTKLLERELYFC